MTISVLLRETYLDEQILEQFLVLVLVVSHLLSDLGLELGSQVLDDGVDLSHFIDSGCVLLLRVLNLQPDFLVV